MSTLKKNNFLNRFQILAQLDEKVFHSDDLASLWKISSPNTLRVTLHRYIAKGLLFPIYRGFYSILPPEKCDPLLLGIKAMHQYAYISTETVLADAGIILQINSKITLISGQSRRFSIRQHDYQSRKLKDSILFNPVGVKTNLPYNIASVPRAVADLLYYNPLFHFDHEKAIDWGEVHHIQNLAGYPPTLRGKN
jgi:predicted transcriptional regulator of viral defense system